MQERQNRKILQPAIKIYFKARTIENVRYMAGIIKRNERTGKNIQKQIHLCENLNVADLLLASTKNMMPG